MKVEIDDTTTMLASIEMDFLNDAVSYVRDNRTWTDAEEAVALARLGAYGCGIQKASPKIAQAIVDLVDEFCEDDAREEGWWEKYFDVDDIFSVLCVGRRAMQIDWIVGIFDECVAREKQAVGFIAGKPFRVTWAEDGKQLIWYAIIPADDAVFYELTRRLKLREACGCKPSEIHRNGYSLFQYFK